MRTTRLGRIGVAVAVGISGFIHLRIWQHEYRSAPVREMFVANWALSALVAVVLVASVAGRIPSRVDRAALLGATLLALGSLAAFALSRGPGLPTLHGTFKEHGLETTAAYFFGIGSAKVALVSETVAATLSGWVLLASVHVRPHRTAQPVALPS